MHLAFKFSQDWMCDFSFMANIELKLAIPSVVWDEYTAWSKLDSEKHMVSSWKCKRCQWNDYSLIMDHLLVLGNNF